MPKLIELAGWLFKLGPLQGYRTYLAAAGALAGAVYFFALGDYEKAAASLVAFLGLVGLRGAGDPPAPTPAPLPEPPRYTPPDEPTPLPSVLRSPAEAHAWRNEVAATPA
jgi:hypothetical protein